jgi:hypothetical protein
VRNEENVEVNVLCGASKPEQLTRKASPMEQKNTDSALVNVVSADGNSATCAPAPVVVVGEASAGAAVSNGGGAGIDDTVSLSDAHEYWRNAYWNCPYFSYDTPYEQYGPAYQYGWESYAGHQNQSFEDVESHLGSEWVRRR